jgi:peptide deformylase
MAKMLIQGLIMSLMSIGLQAQEEQSVNCQLQAPLEIVQMGDPVLRQVARELTKEEILSPKIQQLIEMMKVTMRGVGVGLAAPQIGYSLQIAVIEDAEENLKDLPAELLASRERRPVPFHVIINPKMTIVGSESLEFYEGCLSVHNCMGVVPRARSVRVECLNEKAEPVVIEASGWYARILQHEIDHLVGNLFLDRVLTKSLSTEENYAKYWQQKPIEEIRQLVKEK